MQVSLSLGAVARFSSEGEAQVRQAVSGGSYASNNDPRLHVGLGEATVVDRLEITWPRAGRQVFVQIPADRIYVLAPAND